jgi:heat shock transcription factor, other eukaryote
LIVRKKKKLGYGRDLCEEGEEVRGTIKAVQRLREEQRGMEEELQAMDRRLQAAESHPGQMMAFLAKIADEPGVVLRAMLAKKEELAAGGGGKGGSPAPLEASGKRRRIGGVQAGRGDCVAAGDATVAEIDALGMGAVQSPFSVLGHVFY